MEFIDSHTRENMGMDYVLNMILPKTPYGMESKRNMQYYSKGEELKLQEELNNTEELVLLIKKHGAQFSEIEFILRNFKEIRNSLRRIENGIVIDEVELFEIKNFLLGIKDLGMVQNGIPGIGSRLKVKRNLELEESFDPEGMDNRTFYIYDCYSEELKYIRDEKRRLQRIYDGKRKKIIAFIENMLGITVKLSGEIIISGVDEEKLRLVAECPYIYEESSTKLYTIFRIKKSEEINNLSDKIEELKLKEEQEEYNVRKNLSLKIKSNIDSIYEQIRTIAYMDMLLAKAEFALKINGTKPVIEDDLSIRMINGRHLKLDEILKHQGKFFTPVNCSINKGVTIITGANMGGKTVRLKLIGMLQAMVQLGLYVPAESFKTSIMDYIYFSIGDMQSMDTGLSTFGGEISGMINIINCSNYRGLILVDELARGTNPEEGYAISRAIARYLKGKNSITIFVTHFSDMTNEEGIEHLRVKGLKRVDFAQLKMELEDKGRCMQRVQDYMDYTLEKVEGERDVPRDAINIARLMGLNEEILDWAEEILILEGRRNNEQIKSGSGLDSQRKGSSR